MTSMPSVTSETWKSRNPGPAIWAERPFQYVVFGVAAVLIMAPFVPLIWQAFLTGALYDKGASFSLINLQRVFGSIRFWTAALNTLLFAGAGTLIAQAFGTIFAILIGRTDMPGSKILGPILMWPMILSHLVLSLSWYSIYGPSGYITLWAKELLGVTPWNLYSLAGMSLVAGVSQAPLAYLFCLSSIANSDPTLEDAARGAGARVGTIVLRITLPMLRPAILQALLANFVICVEMLSIPLVFGRSSGIQTISTYLYDEALVKANPDYGLIATSALVTLLGIIGLLALQKRLLGQVQRYISIGGKATRPRSFALGSLRWGTFVIALLYTLFAVVLPLASLIVQSITELLSPLIPFWEVLTLENYRTLVRYPVYLHAIVNTFVISIAGAAIGTICIVVLALVSERSDFPWRPVFRLVLQAPRAMPGIFCGLAFLYLTLSLPLVGGLRNTIWLLTIAFIVRYIPAGLGAILPGLQQIGRDVESSARNVGAGWFRTCYSILLPLLRPAMFSCFALLLILFMREYTTAVFLVAPGSEVIGTTLLQLWDKGETGAVAALATLQVLVTGGTVVVARKLFGVKIYG
jgi:iron(III) transport system permease protein